MTNSKRRWPVLLLSALITTSCTSSTGDDGGPPGGHGGMLAGQVVLAGPVANATVTVSQVSIDDASASIVADAGTATTDATGRFEVDVGELNGLFLIEAAGGEYTEPESGELIELDRTASIRTFQHLDLFASRTDALVSPIGHLTEAMARGYLAAGRSPDIDDALATVKPHLDAHFGNVDWERAAPAALDAPAASPTEPVRAAFVLGAWTVLAEDLAVVAEASRQEVNSYALMVRWAEDLANGPFDASADAGAFDGNDANARGGGLQVGACPPVDPGCTAPSGCALGACRALCDLYAGTPRALLGGEMVKLMRSGRNHTGLSDLDLLPVANAISDNADPFLFGGTCSDELDQLPPTLMFDGVTPAEGAYVRHAITVHVVAVDDTDLSPVAGFLAPLADMDGDPSNSIAEATIDTTAGPDGPFTVVATATDRSNNMAMAMRSFAVDNTPPSITVASTGFLVDGSQWWSDAAAPNIGGTVNDAAPVTVRARIGATPIATAIVTGTTWSLTIPTGAIAAIGDDVVFEATDAAGNTRQVVQRLRIDSTPPTLVVNASPVKTETADAVTFPAGPYDFVVTHVHGGTTYDLATTAGCPSVAKYAHLLFPSPPYTAENGGPTGGKNPIQYNLTASDDGIGLDLAGSQYRVIQDATGAVVQSWTAMPAGTSLGDATDYAVPLYGGITALTTTEGQYTVELRVRDRFGRTSSTSRCWTHQLLAPPLKASTPVTAATAGMSRLGLSSTTLAAPSGSLVDDVAAKLLNDDSPGAALTELTVWNGTELPVYLTTTLTPASTVTVQQSFVLRNAKYNVTAPSGNTNCATNPSACTAPASQATYTSPLSAATPVAVSMSIRVYAVASDGSLGAELLPCSAAAGCATAGTTYEFLLPGRDPSALHNQPPKRYLIATMSGRIPALRPVDTAHMANPPFLDTSVSSPAVEITGIVGSSSTGCTTITTVIVNGIETERCSERASVRPYRASTQLKLTTSGTTTTSYGSAATTALATRTVVNNGVLAAGYVWNTLEGALPPSY